MEHVRQGIKELSAQDHAAQQQFHMLSSLRHNLEGGAEDAALAAMAVACDMLDTEGQCELHLLPRQE